MNLLRDLLELFFPRCCCLCGSPLVGDERELCLRCQMELPMARNADGEANFVEKRLVGRVDFEAATALLIFKRKSKTRELLHQIKYYGNTRLAHLMGRQMGLMLARSGRFAGVDLLVPVPLHRRKERRRGYNQSLLLCRGIAETFPRPIVTGVLVRHKRTSTQTRMNRQQRLDNMKGVFSVAQPDTLKGKHILLVDDVLTTGATTEACCLALQSVDGLRISIAALAVSGDN